MQFPDLRVCCECSEDPAGMPVHPCERSGANLTVTSLAQGTQSNPIARARFPAPCFMQNGGFMQTCLQGTRALLAGSLLACLLLPSWPGLIACFLVGRLAGLACLLAGRLARPLLPCLLACSPACRACFLACLLACWLAGLACWLAGLAGSLPGLLARLIACRCHRSRNLSLKLRGSFAEALVVADVRW